MFGMVNDNGGIGKIPDGILRFLVANGVRELAERGDPIAQKCFDLICVMQAMGLSTGTKAEREGGEKPAESAPEVPEVKPEGNPESGKFSAVNRMKPFLN